MTETSNVARIIKGRGTPPAINNGDIVFDFDGKIWTNDENGNKIVVADKGGLPDPMVFSPTITIPLLEEATATISMAYLYYSQTGAPKSHVSTDWEVRKTADNSLVFSSNTTGVNLTSVLITGLEQNTEYKIRSKVNMATVSSAWGEVIATTATSFPSKLDIFNDGSGLALITCDDNVLDTGGVHNGVWTGTEAYVTGKLGKAITITDKNTIVRVEVGEPIYTMSFWANRTIYGGRANYLMDDQVNSGHYIMVGYYVDPPKLHIATTTKVYINGVQKVTGDTIPTDNTWNHYLIKFTGTIPTRMNLGNYATLGGVYNYAFNGHIDHIRFFNRVLTSAEEQILREELT